MAAIQSRSFVGATTPTTGYESPTEENQPPFFFTASPTGSGIATPVGVSFSTATSTMTPMPRPLSLSRSSHQIPPPLDKETNPNGPLTLNPSLRPNLSALVSSNEKLNSSGRVSLKDRIACYQWTYFTMTMATGGIANILHGLSYKAHWLTGIGVFFCLLNIVLFLTNCVLISSRFYLTPGSLMRSFTDQVESLFIPAFVVSYVILHLPGCSGVDYCSIGMININICQYGIQHCGVWLLKTMEILFWTYLALSVFASAGLYLVLWSTLVFPVHTMTPTWVFPAYPLLLTAPFAANLIAAAQKSGYSSLPDSTAIAFAAFTTQGTGCLIAFMISAAFIYRLMTQKLPRDMQRPGVFISIGPFGFTAGSVAQLGSQAKIILPNNFLDTVHSVEIFKVVSLMAALWLWGLAIWFFLVSVGSLWKYVRTWHGMPFQMTWWSFVFPNTALVGAIEIMGEIFDNKGIKLFGCVMTIILIIVWIAVFATMIRCLKEKKLLWPKAK